MLLVAAAPATALAQQADQPTPADYAEGLSRMVLQSIGRESQDQAVIAHLSAELAQARAELKAAQEKLAAADKGASSAPPAVNPDNSAHPPPEAGRP